MRKQLVIALAYELREVSLKSESVDSAYIWFNGKSKEHNLTREEEFNTIFVAGLGKIVSISDPKYPWENKDIVIDKAEPAPAKIARKNPPIKQKPVTPSAKCLKDARKALGAYPYNEGCNFLVGDGYFSRSCVDKYGSRQWEAALEQVRQEMKR